MWYRWQEESNARRKTNNKLTCGREVWWGKDWKMPTKCRKQDARRTSVKSINMSAKLWELKVRPQWVRRWRRGETQGGTAEELLGGEAGFKVGFELVCVLNQLKAHHLEIDSIDTYASHRHTSEISDHCHKANITTGESPTFFGFPVHIKVMLHSTVIY